jgi:GNAT superfamily N-acetyltransferase
VITYSSELPEENKFAVLFETTGWNEDYHTSPDEFSTAFANSWYTLSAYDGTRLVGFGRIVSDRVLHAMIYELIVLPAYQNQGIGGEILARLVHRCQQFGIRDIQLFCAAGKRPFYENRGFVARADNAPGMYYVGKVKAE